MIGKLTDIGELSGVSSPLLPLIYCDFYSCSNDTDGVYIQTVDGDITLVLSLKNGSVSLSLLSDNWDKDELLSFVKFTHTGYITADFKWDDSVESFCLMERSSDNVSYNDVTVITPQSTVREYRNIHSLLGDAGDDFDSWYVQFSGKVNNGSAVAVYTEDFRSCAVCTAVSDGTGIVAGVYTDEQYRGKGYGKKVVSGLLSAMNSAGISDAVLWCEDKNIAFYENLGFTRKGEIYYSEVI